MKEIIKILINGDTFHFHGLGTGKQYVHNINSSYFIYRIYANSSKLSCGYCLILKLYMGKQNTQNSQYNTEWENKVGGTDII